jgi:hypothetical protein
MRDLTLRHTAGAGVTFRADAGTLVERILVDSVAANACQVTNDAVIRDSVCWMRSASPARHALIASSTTGEPANVTLRNVTAVRTAGSGAGVRLVSGSGVDAALDGRNVIAQGSVDSDVSVQGSGGGGDASATFANSNYDTAIPNPGGGTATTTPPTDPGIQTAPPAFVNAGSGDFREAAGSPTINSGSGAASLLGTTDIDGAPRIQGSAPDIGAYEFDQIAPSVAIDSGPGEGETLDTSTASFTFSTDDSTAGFTCELDGRGFGPCTGPGAAHTASGLGNGSHTFSVRATDPNGNASVANRGFSVSVSPPAGDTDPPQTTITKHPPNRTEKERAKFKFRSDEAGSTFRCKRDRKPWKPCTSPRKYRNLDEGKHKFKVAAIDPAGNMDRTPDKDTWKVLD